MHNRILRMMILKGEIYREIEILRAIVWPISNSPVQFPLHARGFKEWRIQWIKTVISKLEQFCQVRTSRDSARNVQLVENVTWRFKPIRSYFWLIFQYQYSIWFILYKLSRRLRKWLSSYWCFLSNIDLILHIPPNTLPL